MTRALLRIASTLLLFSGIASLRAEPVSRTPPEVFARVIEPLLTPLADVLPGRTAFPKDDSHGIVLLSESLYYRDADGTDYHVIHDAYLASDDSAAEFMGNRIYSYNREHESIFLIKAATVNPAGARQELDDRAAFLQTPQHEAENGLYTSDQELNLIFPKVVQGAVTEMVILIRVDKPVFPGEFAEHKVFANGWPAYRSRLVLDFPVQALDRVHIVAASPLVPSPVVEHPGPGRARKTWTREHIAKLEWEEAAPAIQFRAPTLWLTTLDSWDQVATWFGRLVQDRGELGPDLEKELDRWTTGLTDPKSIIAKVCTAVANDVRYTGLEFGLAGYQPYPCAQVWANRYGDCKDKANLLRALLARKGIKSHLVLLQTEQLGRVEKRSPSWKQFNHAILAVDLGREGYFFCDPTIKYVTAGLLGKGDMARPVLLVKDGHAEWVQTPDLLNNSLHYSAELSLTPAGELSGWFTLQAEGTDAASYAEYYNNFDAPQRRRTLQELVEAFFPGVEIMDLDYTPLSGAVSTFKIRCYFLRKPGSASSETMPFPYPTGWLPTVGTSSERLYPYATTRRIEQLDVTVNLPENWNATHPVEPFNAVSPFARFEAAWSHEPGKLHAHLLWQPEFSELGPKDYAVFQRSVRALRSWLEHPAQIAPGAAVATTAARTPLSNFPVLATGAGQMRLLEQRFPSGDNDDDRRAALEQVLQWFPDDVDTIFDAKLFLILIQQKADPAAQAKAIGELLTRYGTQITPESRAWARYIANRESWKASHDPAALADLKSMADDKALSSYRRSWSAYSAALFLSEKDPAAALELLSHHDTTAEDSRDSMLQLEARLLARRASAPATKEWAERLVREVPDDADNLLENALRQLIDDHGDLPRASLVQLAEALAPVFKAGAGLPKATAQLERIQAFADSDRIRREYVKKLGDWIDAHPRPWLTAAKSARFADTAAATKEIEAMNKASKGRAVVDDALQLFRYHDIDYPTFAKYLFWCGWWLHRDHTDPDLLNALADGVFNLPLDESTEIAGFWNKYGADLVQQKQDAAARSVYQRVVDHPGVEPYQRVEAAGEIALIELRAGRLAAAAAAFAICTKDHLTHQRGSEYLFAATLLELELKHDDKALELLKEIGRDEKKYLSDIRYATAVDYLLTSAQRPDALRAYWQRTRAWRADWDKLLQKYEVSPAAAGDLPLLDDINTVQKRLAQNVARKDTAGFLRSMDLLVRTSQWIPIFLGNVCTQSEQAGTLSPALQHDLFRLELQLVQDFPRIDETMFRTARIWEIIFLTNLDRKSEAVKLARELFEAYSIDQPAGAAGLRLWLTAAAGSPDAPTAIAAANQTLAGSAEVSERLLTVAVLSDTLLRQHDVAANVVLLDRELQRPDAAASEMKTRLTDRLRKLREDAMSNGDFTKLVRTWLHDQKLDWLLSMPPLNLNGPRYANPGPGGFYDNIAFSNPESFKANMLLVLDESRPINLRHRAFVFLVTFASATAPIASDYVAHLQAALAITSLPDGIRRQILSAGLSNLLTEGHPELARKFLAAEPSAFVRSDLQASLTSAFALADALRQFEPAAAADAVRAALKQPVNETDTLIIRSTFERLVYAGESKLASSVLEGAANLAVASGSRTSASSLQLEWTRLIRRETAALPFYQRVRDILVKECAPSAADSKGYGELTSMLSLEFLDGTVRSRMVAAIFKEGLFRHVDPLVAANILGYARGFISTRRNLGPELTAAVLESGLDDNRQASWLSAVGGFSDPDTPAVRSRVEKMSRDFLAKSSTAANQQARQAVRLLLGHYALRTSLEARPEDLFGPDAIQEIPPQTLSRLQLMFFNSRGQKREAAALLDRIEPEQWSEPGLVAHAFATLEDQAERKLLLTATREKMERRLPDLWLNNRPGVLIHAANNAHFIGAPDLLADALFDHAIESHQDKRERQEFRLSRAALHGDWPVQLEAANQILAVAPEYYDVVYQRGDAQFHLGDKASAKKDLELFLEKCLDSPLRPEAEKMLAEINAH